MEGLAVAIQQRQITFPDGPIRTAMMTGDNRRTAEAVAYELGIERVFAAVLPEQKAEHGATSCGPTTSAGRATAGRIARALILIRTTTGGLDNEAPRVRTPAHVLQ
jgi:hypothetical protein